MIGLIVIGVLIVVGSGSILLWSSIDNVRKENRELNKRISNLELEIRDLQRVK